MTLMASEDAEMSEGRLVERFERVFPQGSSCIGISGAITVYVRATVYEVLEVCQINENFTVTFGLEFFYVDPELRNFESKILFRDGSPPRSGQIVEHPLYGTSGMYSLQQADGSVFTVSPDQVAHISQPEWGKDTHFKVHFAMPNVVEEPTELAKEQHLEYCTSKGGHILHKIKYLATFREKLELQNMPFDRQMLQIEFVAELPLYSFYFYPLDVNAGSLERRGGHSVPAAWIPESAGDGHEPAILQVKKPHFAGNVSSFDIVIHLRRRSNFYMFNIVFMVFFITSLVSASFFIPPQKIDARAAVSFALLLATVAYKLTIVAWIPVKEYLTFLDIYLLSSFIFQFVAMGENIIVAGCFDDETGEKRPYEGLASSITQWCHHADDVDDMAFRTFFSAWVGWHFLFFLWPRFSYSLFYFIIWIVCWPYEAFNKLSRRFHDTCHARGRVGQVIAPFVPFWSQVAHFHPWRAPGETWTEVYEKNDFPKEKYHQKARSENPFGPTLALSGHCEANGRAEVNFEVSGQEANPGSRLSPRAGRKRPPAAASAPLLDA